MMKKFFAIALSALLVLSLAACSGQTAVQPAKQGDPSDNAQIANPFTDYETLEEAEAAAGFTYAVPDAIANSGISAYRVMTADDGNMIEVCYENGADLRKAPGEADISGNFETYAQQQTVTVGDHKALLTGTDDVVYLATWSANGYTYAVSIEEGLTAETMSDLIASIA